MNKKILLCLFVLAILIGCGGGDVGDSTNAGTNSGTGGTGGNWDQMKWDQDKWG